MVNNPFGSDYVGTPATQTSIAQTASVHATKTALTLEAKVGVDIASGFKITPIPMVSGKPKRVIIKGKVTRD
jgi:hypothetical protein